MMTSRTLSLTSAPAALPAAAMPRPPKSARKGRVRHAPRPYLCPTQELGMIQKPLKVPRSVTAMLTGCFHVETPLTLQNPHTVFIILDRLRQSSRRKTQGRRTNLMTAAPHLSIRVLYRSLDPAHLPLPFRATAIKHPCPQSRVK